MQPIKIQASITSRTSASLSLYFAEISKHEPLSVDQEISLARRIKEGDQAALQQMVQCNLRFVVSVAKQYQFRGMDLIDLISEGNLGLIKAANLFDETRGFKFISYAVWWIRQSIMNAITQQADFIRKPLNKISMMRKIRGASSKFEQKHEREPTEQEMQDIITEMRKGDFDMKFDDTASLDAAFSADAEGSLMNVIKNENTLSPDEGVMKESLKKNIEICLSVLSQREAEILRMYFGISCTEKTMYEISLKYGCSVERIRQIKEKALKKIRRNAKLKKIMI